MASRHVSGWVVVAPTLVGIWFVFIVWSQWSFGSFSFAYQYLRGSRLQLRTPVMQVGVHRPGEHFDAEVRITNHDAQPATIIGAGADRPCASPRGLC